MPFNPISVKARNLKTVQRQIMAPGPVDKPSPFQPYIFEPKSPFRQVIRHHWHNDQENPAIGQTFVVNESVINRRRVTSNHFHLHGQFNEVRINSKTSDRIRLDHGSRNNSVNTGRGSDIVWDDGDNNMIHLGEGNDQAYLNNTTLNSVSSVYGDSGDDFIVGSDWAVGTERLYGGNDDDTLIARGTGTQLFGESGDDTLIFSLRQVHWNVEAPRINAHGGEGKDLFVMDAVMDDLLFAGVDDWVQVVSDFTREDQLLIKNNGRRQQRGSYTYEAIEEDLLHIFYEGELQMEVHLQGWTVFDEDFSVRGGGDGVDLAFGARGNVPRVMDRDFNLG